MDLSLLGLSGGMIALFVVLGVLVVAFIVILCLVPLRTWFIALISGAHVSMTRLIGMRMRRIKVAPIIDAYIQARKAGIAIDIVDLETHYMAGGNIEKIIVRIIPSGNTGLIGNNN